MVNYVSVHMAIAYHNSILCQQKESRIYLLLYIVSILRTVFRFALFDPVSVHRRMEYGVDVVGRGNTI